MKIQKISYELLIACHPVCLFHPVCLLVFWKFSTLYDYSILYLYLVLKSSDITTIIKYVQNFRLEMKFSIQFCSHFWVIFTALLPIVLNDFLESHVFKCMNSCHNRVRALLTVLRWQGQRNLLLVREVMKMGFLTYTFQVMYIV